MELSDSGSGDLAKRAEEIFTDHLANLDDGDGLDIEALCAEHPEIVEELQGLLRDWNTKGQQEAIDADGTLAVPAPENGDGNSV
ncbi:MAG: hypothetical protein V3T77_11370, partial [Planctomycetota bacterium]